MAEMKRNTSTGANGLWEWRSEPIKRFRWYSRFRDGRELVEDDERDGRPKSTRTEVKYCCCCWFGKNWPSNRIKNDSRIFKHPRDRSSSDSERRFGKEKDVCTFCSTILDTWAKGKSSAILPRHYRDGLCRQNFFKQHSYGRRDPV